MPTRAPSRVNSASGHAGDGLVTVAGIQMPASRAAALGLAHEDYTPRAVESDAAAVRRVQESQVAQGVELTPNQASEAQQRAWAEANLTGGQRSTIDWMLNSDNIAQRQAALKFLQAQYDGPGSPQAEQGDTP